jgi:hypothetical protein
MIARVCATVVLVAIGIAGVVALDRVLAGDGPAATILFVEDFPTPGYESSPRPLGRPTAASAGGPHAFVALQDDGVTPVAYDPCRPVHYVVRPDQMPAGGGRIVRESVREIAELTGLRFVYDGTTREDPSPDRAPYQPERYGDRWAPVLVSWASVDEVPELAGTVAGQAGSVAMSAGGVQVFVNGSGQLTDLLQRPGGRADTKAVVLHELGHLVGLDHVSDVHQLMHPSSTHVAGFAPGDLEGLAALGRGDCVPEL